MLQPPDLYMYMISFNAFLYLYKMFGHVDGCRASEFLFGCTLLHYPWSDSTTSNL